MNRKRVSVVALVMICFASGVALAQQKVPPPPKPTDDSSSSSETTAKFLQDKLNSIGRVSWNQTTRNTKANTVIGPVQAWEEVSRATITARTCEMRVMWKSSIHDAESGATFFLEEFDNVTVTAYQELMNRNNQGNQYTMSPTPYSVGIAGVADFPTPYSVGIAGGADFKLRDEESANQIAGALRQLAQQCRVATLVARSEPNLEETLNFIEDKLNQLGTVIWVATWQDTVAGTSAAPQQNTQQFSGAVGDPGACRVKYHVAMGGPKAIDFDFFLNLRRIEKLTVVNMQDELNAVQSRAGHSEWVGAISPAIWELEIKGAANRQWLIPFRDEETANRVAKALLHAVELCGGGNKDPF